MATNEEIVETIDDCYEKLIAAEAAHPNSPELAALHVSLKAARDKAVEHFGLNIGQRSGGGDKNDPNPPEDPPGEGEG